MPQRNFTKRNGFRPSGCAINDCKTIVAIFAKLQWAQKVNVKIRKTSMRDGDVHRLEAGVAVDLGLLAVQAGLGSGCDILGEVAPDKSRKNQRPNFLWNNWAKNTC
jgi:hypothetical protein